jgi:hypothetical protein
MSRRLIHAVLGATSITLLLVACTPTMQGSEQAAVPTSSLVQPTPDVATTMTSSTPSTPPTCENTATTSYRERAASGGWVSWTLPHSDVGASAFDGFPDPLDRQVTCRWGASPNVATDNILDLGWAAIDAARSIRAQQFLTEQGLIRLEASEGVYLTTPDQAFMADAEGYGQTYLFTASDVRYALTKEDVSLVKAPEDMG